MEFEFRPVRAWLCAVTAALFIMLGSASLNMMAPVLSLVLDEFHGGTTLGSDLSALHTAASAVATIPIGFAINRWGFRPVAFVGIGCLAVSGFLGYVGGFEALLISRVIQGVGYAVPVIVSLYVVTEWFPTSHVAYPLAFVSCGTTFSKIFSQQLSKVAIPLGGWREQFLLFGIVCVAAAVLMFFFMRSGPGAEIAMAEKRAKDEKKQTQEKAPLLVVLKNPFVWAVVILSFVYSVGNRGFQTFANMIWVDCCGMTATEAADLNSVYSVFRIFSAFLFAYLVECKFRGKGMVLAALISIYLVVRSFIFGFTEPWEAWVFCTIIGLFAGVAHFCNLCMPVLVRDPKVLAMALTLLGLVGKHIAGIVAPYSVSVFETMYGSWAAAIIPTAITGIIGVVCAFLLGYHLDKAQKRRKEFEDAPRANA